MKKHELLIVLVLSMIPLWALLALLISVMWDALGGEGNIPVGAMMGSLFVVMMVAPVIVFIMDNYKEPKP